MKHLTLDIISRILDFEAPFILVDSSFLMFPLKYCSLTKPQHSRGLCKAPLILFAVVFIRIIWLKCQNSFPSKVVWIFTPQCLSAARADLSVCQQQGLSRHFWELMKPSDVFPGELIYTLKQFRVKSQEVHGAHDAPVFPSLVASKPVQ